MACVWLNAYSEYKGLEPVYYRGNAVWKDDSSTSGTFSWNQTKNGYRLPTECEWEFAAGGGSEAEHDKYIYAGSNTIREVAWYDYNSGDEAHKVGTKKPNALGLYDMSGNVGEWCFDCYADWGTGELTNPVHWSGAHLVLKWGSLYQDSSSCTIFYRNYHSSYTYYSSTKVKWVGIRIARNAE